MALVVLLRGVNVGGHKTFRPSALAKDLHHFDIVNIGAAGTFVVRAPVGRTQLRAELARRLPFETEAVICDGTDLVRLASGDPFAGEPSGKQYYPFVSVLAKRRKAPAPLPFIVPAEGEWGMKVLGCQDQFVYGICRREMKAIGYIARIEKMFGVPATTRTWSTIQTIARALK